MSLISFFLQGLVIGLLSSAHCVGMCGGLLHALKQQKHRGFVLIWHQLGRISVYFFLTLFLATLLNTADTYWITVIRSLSIVFLILLAAYFWGYKGYQRLLERLSLPLWRSLAPMANRLNKSPVGFQQFFAGVLWGFIPCGLLYSIVPYASTLGPIHHSLSFISGFALATLLSLSLSLLLFQRLLGFFNQRWLKKLTAATLLLFAILHIHQLYF